MYTRCPHCATIFRVTAAQLRAALGEVSCGSCRATFNALSALTEELPQLTEVVVLDPLDEGRSIDEAAPTAMPESPTTETGHPGDATPLPLLPNGAGDESRDSALTTAAGDATMETPQSDDAGDQHPAMQPASPRDGEAPYRRKMPAAHASGSPEQPLAEYPDVRADETPAEPDRHAVAAEAPAEPRYDDDTGYEEVDIAALSADSDRSAIEEGSAPGDAKAAQCDDGGSASTWASILANVDDGVSRDASRVLEAAARQTRAIDGDPAYDDATGIDELPDSPTGEPDDGMLEFNAPENSWSEIFQEPDGHLTPAPQGLRETSGNAGGAEQEDSDDTGHVPCDDADAAPDPSRDDAMAAADGDSLDLSPLSPLESATADPDEWAGFLSDITPDDDRCDDAADTDDAEYAGPIIVLGDDGADAVPDNQTNEAAGKTADDAWVSSAAAVIGDANTPAMHTETDQVDERLADPLIDYGPEFGVPWESSEDAVPTGADDDSPPRFPLRRIALATVLILVLGVQLIHYNRDALAANPAWGASIRSVYTLLDQPLYPDWNLDAYRVTASEAVAGRTASGALDIMANVVIAGAEPVGLPMIRVALHDRWSTPVASRVFSPDEYLRSDMNESALVEPGTMLPVEISVADPGTDAQGYVVDICLPRRATGLQCQLEKPPFRP